MKSGLMFFSGALSGWGRETRLVCCKESRLGHYSLMLAREPLARKSRCFQSEQLASNRPVNVLFSKIRYQTEGKEGRECVFGNVTFLTFSG